MRKYYDLHVHTKHSTLDGEKSDANSITELSRRAVELGLSGVAFSDHFDVEDILNGKYPLDCDAVRDECITAKNTVGKDFDVIHSVEIGTQRYFQEFCAENIAKYRYDMVLSSVHVLKKGDEFVSISRTNYSEMSEHESRQMFDTYMQDVLYTAKNCDFDVLTHLTYPLRYFKRHGILHIADIKSDMDIYDEVFRIIIQRGIAPEINTSGIRQGHGGTFPDMLLAKRYMELGGELFTVGSDSHYPEHLGSDIKDVTDMLYGIGARYTVFFKERKPVFVKL